MRGSPLRQWLVFLVGWLLLWGPIRWVTGQSEAGAGLAVADIETIPAWLSLRFSEPPHSFSVTHAGQLIWEEKNPEGRIFERQITMRPDPWGAEFMVNAGLPDREHAIEVAVEPEGRDRRARTLWVSGAVADTFSFSWGSHE